jgi:uncharacterized protein YkwD
MDLAGAERMRRPSCKARTGLWLLLAALSAASTARADVLATVQVLRAGGCGGVLPLAQPIHRDAMLDQAARQWAAGRLPAQATAQSGYRAQAVATLHVSSSPRAMLETLRRSDCRTVADRTMRDIGIYQSGAQAWLVFATLASTPVAVPAPPPPRHSAPAVAAATAPGPSATLAGRALQLVNEVRARGTRCGSRSFAPVAPIMLSGTLAGVASGHANDMAVHGYFEHEDLAGNSPADRVRAVGYREKLVGENIAYGPLSVEDVVQGWLDSPGHCENIMDPRFAEMGIAYAAGHSTRRGLFWVQVLAEPRS